MIKINKNIILLGIVSFQTDLSSEMIFPVLPVFLDHFLKAHRKSNTTCSQSVEGVFRIYLRQNREEKTC
ncbi:MAG: hypothetical protein Q9M89_04955 [Persephonella sp.]|nr:hypothetical protein [Persephonella sp.]